MLPIAKIVQRFKDIIVAAMPEIEDRIYLNRTLPLSAEQNQVPAITISQGAENPITNASDFEYAGWLADVEVSIVASGGDEQAIVDELNTYRGKILAAVLASGNLSLPFVLEIGIGPVVAPVTDGTSSTITKELQTGYQILYRVPRNNYDV
jgi:hypothetical protein